MSGYRKIPDKPMKKLGGTSGAGNLPLEPAVNQQKSESLRPLLDQMQKISETLCNMESVLNSQQKQLTETAQKMEEIAQKCLISTEDTKKIKKKVNKIEKHQEMQEKRILMLQMEKSNLTLRFQGIKEEEKEDLRSMLANALAPLTGREAQKLSEEMDVAYRAYSNFTKKNNLSAEVVVKFTKQRTRDQILRATSAMPLKIGEQDIRILKDVPYEIRMKRKAYKGLTLFLQKHQIGYKWAIPEGLLFKFNDKREKIDSVFKAQEFLKRHASSEEDAELAKWTMLSSEEDSGPEEGGAESEDGGAKKGPSYNLRKTPQDITFVREATKESSLIINPKGLY